MSERTQGYKRRSDEELDFINEHFTRSILSEHDQSPRSSPSFIPYARVPASSKSSKPIQYVATCKHCSGTLTWRTSKIIAHVLVCKSLQEATDASGIMSVAKTEREKRVENGKKYTAKYKQQQNNSTSGKSSAQLSGEAELPATPVFVDLESQLASDTVCPFVFCFHRGKQTTLKMS